MNKMYLILLLLLAAPGISAQENTKDFKRVIPVKKLVSVKTVPFGEELYLYRAKSDTGIWDNRNNRIIIDHLSQYAPLHSSDRYMVGISNKIHYLMNLETGDELLASDTPFWVLDNRDTNALVIGNADFCGFLDLKTEELNLKRITELEGKEQDELIWFHSDTLWTDFSQYEDWEIMEYHIPDYRLKEETYHLFKRGNYLVLDYVDHDSIIVFHPDNGNVDTTITGNMLWTDQWLVISDRGKYNRSGDDGRIYYNSDFEVAIERIELEDMGKAQLSRILGKKVTYLRPLRTGVVSDHSGFFVYKADGKYGIYSVPEEKDLIGPVDFLFELGEDIQRGRGFSFYVAVGSYFGFYSTNYGWEVKADKTGIQLLALSDGTYAYLADGVLYPKQGPNWKLESIAARPVTEADLKNFMVVHHITKLNDKLLVSGRFAFRDDHDDAYYSNTSYQDEYGIIGYGKDTSYLTGKLHTVEFFDDHYIVQHAVSWSGYPEDLLILNKELDTLEMPHKLRFSWIWNGMFLTNAGDRLVEYDLKNKEIKRILGPAYETRDFHVKEGYLLLGHNEYSRYNRQSGEYHFDIASIITPEGKMVDLTGMVALHILPGDIAVVGEVPDGTEIQGYTDFVIKRHFRPSKKALLDLKTGALLTDWLKTLYVYNEVVHIQNGEGPEAVVEEVPVREFRTWAKEHLK